ncbi:MULTISPECIES: hypothetical protein [unclassified Nocardioides]|uniref:hypothetical protein n=1 Tax=unclassified Nocardioides TaxID=2615069 RepID=UPI000A4D17F2|nr:MULTISPECIES: hypothetical protein [unclassified Nocardioides]
MSTNPARRRWRNRLFLLGIVPLLAALLFVTKVGMMLSAQADGQSAYDKDKFSKAAKAFGDNASLNVMEAWISPFNEGAAKQRDEDYDGALEKYDDALKDVPDDKECTVRINIALVHEVLGDTAAEKPDGEAALKSWQTGRDALAEADCPTDAGERTDDAKAVDERLRQKIEQEKQKQQENPPPPKKDDKKEKKKQEKLKKQKEKLEKRNDKGRVDRKKSQDFEDYDYDSDPGYEW